MKRKTPVKHKVRSHSRNGNSVDSYVRGEGENHLANPKKFDTYTQELADKALELGLAEEVVGRDSSNSKFTTIKLTKKGKELTNGQGSGILDLSMEDMEAYEKELDKPKPKHYVVRYRTTWQNGRTNVDTTNSFVHKKKDIIQDILEKSYGHISKSKQPRIEVIKATLQTPQEKKLQLRALLDVDNRTRSRMKRGYVLVYIKISDIDLPPIRRQLRLEDNREKMEESNGMPPAHLYYKKNGRYGVADGVHRIHSAKELGYDTIPALVMYGGGLR